MNWLSNLGNSIWNGISGVASTVGSGLSSLLTSGTGYNPLTRQVASAADAFSVPQANAAYATDLQGNQTRNVYAVNSETGQTTNLNDQTAMPAYNTPNPQLPPNPFSAVTQPASPYIYPNANPVAQSFSSTTYGPVRPSTAGGYVAPVDQYGRTSNSNQGNTYIDANGMQVTPKAAFSGISGSASGGYSGGATVQSNLTNLATQGQAGRSSYTGNLGATGGMSTPAVMTQTTPEDEKKKQAGGMSDISQADQVAKMLFGSPLVVNPLTGQPTDPTIKLPSNSLSSGLPDKNLNVSDLASTQQNSQTILNISQANSQNDLGDMNSDIVTGVKKNYDQINSQKPTPKDALTDSPALASALQGLPSDQADQIRQAWDRVAGGQTQLTQLTTQRVDTIKQIQAVQQTYQGVIDEIKANPNMPKNLASRRLESVNTAQKGVLQGLLNTMEVLNQSISDQQKFVDSSIGLAQYQEDKQLKLQNYAKDVLSLMVSSHAIGGFTDSDISMFSKQTGLPSTTILALKDAANRPESKLSQLNDGTFVNAITDLKTGKVTLQTLGKYAKPVASVTSAADVVPGTDTFKVAQDLAYGTLTFQQFRTLYSYSRDTGAKIAIYQKAAELNPNFNPSAFELGYKVASNPKIRQQISALDNVVGVTNHIVELSNLAARSGVKLLNGAIVQGGIQIGDTRYSNLAAAQTAYADELSGALGFGSATDMTRQLGFNLTDTALSPQAFAASINDVVLPFIQSKRQSIINQMGIYGDPVNQMSNGTTTPSTGTSSDPLGLFK